METTPKNIADIQNMRGMVGTNFASFEFLIARFITFHYFKGTNEDFLTEVFEDEYFSFGLLMKIFDKILQKYPEEYKNFPFQKLRRLQRLRNTIIHSRLQSEITFETIPGGKQEVGEMYFHHAGKEYNVANTFKEYEKLRSVVQPAIEDLPGVREQFKRIVLKGPQNS